MNRYRAMEKEFHPLFPSTLPTGIYGILAERFSLGRGNIEVAREMVAAGVATLQYREKLHRKSRKEILKECRSIREITREAGVMFIVNDFAHIAAMVDADGVHCGQDDLPVNELRKIVGDKMIGISTHCPEQAEKAVDDGADYIGVGPIFKTETKENVCAPVGFDYLEYVVENIALPFVAIGGIKAGNLPDVLKRGAKSVCLVTEIVGAKSITQKVNELNYIYEEYAQ